MTITDTASNALTWINGTRRLNFPRQRAALWSDDLHQRASRRPADIGVAASGAREARRACESAPDRVTFDAARNPR